MKRYTFKVPIFGDVKITLVQVEGREDKKAVLNLLKVHHITEKDDIDYVMDNVDNKEYDMRDGGDTFYRLIQREMVVIFYPFSSDEAREDVMGHEKRHVEDRLLNFLHVDDIESAGLLAGFLSKEFYKFKTKILSVVLNREFNKFKKQTDENDN